MDEQPPRPGPAVAAGLISGQIVAAYGRRYIVETAAGLISCVPRGKRSEYACGDRVAIARTGAASSGPSANTGTGLDEGVIEAVDPRSTLFFRSAAHRRKLIAANATQIAVVVAAEPSFSDELVSRVLVAAEQAGLKTLLVLNKCDIADAAVAAAARLEPFARAGYPILHLSAIQDATALRAALIDETTVLVGQSGMGKSTLINALFPNAHAATREISTFLASGKHTTTHALLYRLDMQSAVIDCPGMQEFGLAHVEWRDIAAGFREFLPFTRECRFPDCRHLREPGCAVTSATEDGSISPRRLELYRRIIVAEAHSEMPAGRRGQ